MCGRELASALNPPEFAVHLRWTLRSWRADTTRGHGEGHPVGVGELDPQTAGRRCRIGPRPAIGSADDADANALAETAIGLPERMYSRRFTISTAARCAAVPT
jgi:hypothetical protein